MKFFKFLIDPWFYFCIILITLITGFFLKGGLSASCNALNTLEKIEEIKTFARLGDK
jgi:hypothetical protein